MRPHNRRSPDETDPRVSPIPAYKFRLSKGISAKRGDYIVIDNGKEEKAYSVATLLQIYESKIQRYPAPVRDMARRALAEFGYLSPVEEEEIKSDTLFTIEGIKVYMTWGPIRRFFARVRGEKVYSESPTELEKIIKSNTSK